MHYAMNMYWEEWRYSSTFLTSALMEVSGQLHALAALPLGKEQLVSHWIGGWMGPRASLDMVAKRKIPSLCWESNHHLDCSLVTIPTVIPAPIFGPKREEGARS
jgi:hypothetical protein